MADPITIVGGGLAGCEAALFLAERATRSSLREMRPNGPRRPTRPEIWESWSAPTPSRVKTRPTPTAN